MSTSETPVRDTVLQVENVHRWHAVDGEHVAVLTDVSFQLERGSFTTIMGPSGSGKSTLLHIVAGLDRPSSGSVRLAGESLADADEDRRTELRRRYVGIVFQFFNLLPDLTVEENVVLPLLIGKERPDRHRDRLEELLAMLGIDHLRRRVPAGLSGGEMQRVSIARALIARPPLLLADEPTGNLSSKAGEEIVALLVDVARRERATVLLVTHNPRDAAVGDRVLFLHDGRMEPEHALTGGALTAHDVYARLEELGI